MGKGNEMGKSRRIINDQIKKAYAAGVIYVVTGIGIITVEQYYQIRIPLKLRRFIYKKKRAV